LEQAFCQLLLSYATDKSERSCSESRLLKYALLSRKYFGTMPRNWLPQKIIDPLVEKKLRHNGGIWGILQMGIAGRRFIISKKGYIGLAPQEALHGDKICILFGGRMLYILRETSETCKVDGVTHACHTFVGDAIIQGLMRGEGMDAISRGEANEQKFYLV
jgi:hypothetical protein